MSSALPHKAQDRVNTYGIVLIGLVSSVLLWVSVVALQAYYNRTAGDLEGERDAVDKSKQVRDLKSKQSAELSETKYVNPQKGIVTIPIARAEGLVLRGLRDQAPSLVPAIGPHDLPTVPAKWGRPPDAAAAPGGAAPAAGAAPVAGAAPAAPGGAAPAAPGAAPAPAGAAPPGAAPAPAAGAAAAGGAAPAPAAGTAPPAAAAPARPASRPPAASPPERRPRPNRRSSTP